MSTLRKTVVLRIVEKAVFVQVGTISVPKFTCTRNFPVFVHKIRAENVYYTRRKKDENEQF